MSTSVPLAGMNDLLGDSLHTVCSSLVSSIDSQGRVQES